uniref:ZP domain-containing protein n=1 Tax=Rhabditophanes sp. KR3021 TaxID=114890 RepID=A0AC35TIN1_9BILA
MSPEKNLLVAGSKQLLIKCNSSRSTRKNNIAEAEFEEIVVNMNPSVDKSNQIKLKQIESDTLTGTGITPKVFLLITKGQNESSLGVSRAKIGQSLKLMVQFEEAKLFNFMVTNCFSDDGKNTSGAHLSIIDKKGCAVALPRAIGDKQCNADTKEIEEDDSIKEHTNQEFNTMQVKYKLAIEP